jgi:hypothetical protein
MPETLLASGLVTLPPALVLTTVKAALDFAAGSAGSISSQAAVLAHGFLRSMLLSKAKVVSVSLLAMTFVATAAGMVASQIVKGPVPNQANDDAGKTAALACQANLDAFSYYKCRFTITLANAASSEDALAGKYTTSRPYEHLLVVDGGKEKLQTLADIQPQVDKRRIQWHGNLGFTQADWVPLAYLRKGDKALNYASSPESVGEFRFWQGAKSVI